MKASRTAAILLAVLLAAGTRTAAFNQDDVQYWVGSGTNQAMLVIDWNGSASQSVAWGFRWNGTATGMDMLEAIAGSGLIREANGGAVTGTLNGADTRLYARLSTWYGAANTVFGLGYDVNNNASGFVSGYEGAGHETGHANDSADFYAEGWMTGHWNYSVFVPGPGDANGDGEVGPDDFGLLKDNFARDSGVNWGMGDFNRDGEVGPEDFGILKDNFARDGLGSWIACPVGATTRVLSNNDRDAWIFGTGVTPHTPVAAEGPSAGLSPAPEPLSLAGLLLGAAFLPKRRVQNRQAMDRTPSRCLQ